MNLEVHMRHLFLSLIFCVLISPLSCKAEEKNWVWILVETLVNDYATYQGIASVTFRNNNFVAELSDKERNEIIGRIKGEIKGGKIVATVSMYATDVPEKKYSGHYQKVDLKGFDIKTREIIILTDDRRFIGISRAY